MIWPEHVLTVAEPYRPELAGEQTEPEPEPELQPQRPLSAWRRVAMVRQGLGQVWASISARQDAGLCLPVGGKPGWSHRQSANRRCQLGRGAQANRVLVMGKCRDQGEWVRDEIGRSIKNHSIPLGS